MSRPIPLCCRLSLCWILEARCINIATLLSPLYGLLQPPAQTSPMPRTPTAAALIQSLLGASPRSASCASPMEGVPERFGPVLQPKTPSFVSLSPPTLFRMHESEICPALTCCTEGVLERFGPILQPKTLSFISRGRSIGLQMRESWAPSLLQMAPLAKASRSSRIHDMHAALRRQLCALPQLAVMQGMHLYTCWMSAGVALEGHKDCALHAQVYTPMEGVPERMGLPDMSIWQAVVEGI